MNRIALNANIGITARYANRHGLIAGATGTGKTVTLQKLCEEFSNAGVPVIVADVKGDIAGLAMDGKGKAAPVQFWDVYGKQGRPFNIGADYLGVDLLARLLELTDAQLGVLEAAAASGEQFESLVDVQRAVDSVGEQFGAATVAAVERQVMRFARNGGAALVKGATFDLAEALQGRDGRGVVNILAAEKLILNPVAYGTLMIWLLREIYERFPEQGDLAKPRLVIFIDEAHLLFTDAPKELLRQIEQTVRLIRSKGVGVYFVTQAPDDIPAPILGQLGNRVQHALRGATARDQRAIRAAAETMPINPAIDAAEAIGRLGVGQALVSVIRADGTPSPAQIVRVDLPDCRLGALSEDERAAFFTAMPIPATGEAAGTRLTVTECLTVATGLALLGGFLWALVAPFI